MSKGPRSNKSSFYGSNSTRSPMPEEELVTAFGMLHISPVNPNPSIGLPPSCASMTGTMAITSPALQFPGDKAAMIDSGVWLGEKKDFHFWWQRCKVFLDMKSTKGMSK